MSLWLHRMHAVRLCALLLCASALAATGIGTARAAVDESDLLPVDQAFALTATAPERGRIELAWKIADGYYLYRHRISVQVVDGGFRADPLQLPRGEKHHDEFFGEVETFRTHLLAMQAGTAADGVDQVTLKVKYQGCADVGVCYPPQTRTLAVALPPASGVAAGGNTGLGALGATERGKGLLLGGGPATGPGEPLPEAQAFAFEAIVGDGNTLLLRFTPARGYYLYRDKTTLRLSGADGIAAGQPRWPRGVQHRDEHFGDVVVYFDQVDVPLPLQRTRADAANVRLTATFQGCQTDGICYPPMTRTVALALPAGTVTAMNTSLPAVSAAAADAGATPVAAVDPATTTYATSNAPAPGQQDAASGPANSAARGGVAEQKAIGSYPGAAEDSRLAAALAGNSRWLTLLGFFGAGLLLAFTPCVLPMIPILSGLIAGQGTRIGTRRALLLSLVYVVANALVFTVAGVVAGLLGANLQAAFQNPWIIAAFAALFVVLALSSFGLYELQLPMALRSRLGAISDRQHGGSLAGVAAMGALSALIVGPCVAPPLAAAVLYIGQSHDPVFGGAALFLLAMGMGVPLLFFGAAAGRGMPTSGPWMTVAQRVFGFVFLGLAVWMLSRILPAPATLVLWGLLLLASATWALSATTQSPRTRLAARFAGLLLAVLGAAELLGALGGGRDPLQPLAGMFGAPRVQALSFRTIKSSADLDRELAAARTVGKPLLFDFYADWCVSCKEMEKYTFTDPAVQAALSGFVLLKADVTANDDLDQALMKRFGIIGPPGTLFFVDGSERRELRLVGYEKAAAFAARVQHADPR
jgi:thiol:disulfide interchange protein DsbD